MPRTANPALCADTRPPRAIVDLPQTPSSRLAAVSGPWQCRLTRTTVIGDVTLGAATPTGFDFVREQQEALDRSEAVDGPGESNASSTGSSRRVIAAAKMLLTNRLWVARRGAALALLLAVIIVSCDQDLGSANGVVVENRTSFDLHFAVLLDQGWYEPVARARAHQSELILPPAVLPASKCTAGAMIALTEDDREIARHDTPLCAGDRWIIDTESPTPTSGASG